MVLKNSKNSSPYSKMYLVTPMVYEKLKQCLSKVDKMDLGNLNKKYVPKIHVDKSEKIIRNITNSEIRPDSDDDDTSKRKILKPEYKSEFPAVGPSSQLQPKNSVQQFDLSQNYMDDFGESEMYLHEDEIDPSDDSFEFGDPIQHPLRVFQDSGTQTETIPKIKKLSVSNTQSWSTPPRLALSKPLGRSDVHQENINPMPTISKPKQKSIGIQSERIEEIPRGFKPMVETSDRLTQTDKSDLIYKQPVMSLKDMKKHKMIEKMLNDAKKGSTSYPIAKSKPRKMIRIKLKGNQSLLSPRPSTSNTNWVEFNERPAIQTKKKPALSFHGIKGKKDTMKFQCDVCQKWFSRKYGLDRHKRTFHGPVGLPSLRRNENYEPVIENPRVVEAITYQPEQSQALTYEPNEIRALTYQPKKYKKGRLSDNNGEMGMVEPYGSTEDLNLRVRDEIDFQPTTSMDHSNQSLATKRGRKYQLARPRKKKVLSEDKVIEKKSKQDRFESWDI